MANDYTQLALAFANALIKGEFNKAYGFLSKQLKTEYSPEVLEQTYQNMVSYFLHPPCYCHVEVLMDDWAYPPKEECDLVWLYVSINADADGEAITVIISEEQKHKVIRYIEWGRP